MTGKKCVGPVKIFETSHKAIDKKSSDQLKFIIFSPLVLDLVGFFLKYCQFIHISESVFSISRHQKYNFADQ